MLIAPSERAVVDVLFDRPGAYTLEHRTPHRVYPLASVVVEEGDGGGAASAAFDLPWTAPELTAERLGIDAWLAAPPDKTLGLVAEMGEIAAPTDGPVTYACPMHPEVTSDRPDHCPHCGMKLVPAALVAGAGGDHAQSHDARARARARRHGARQTQRTASSGRTTWRPSAA